MASFRLQRSRLLDITLALAAGCLILFAVHIRDAWRWARGHELRWTGRTRVTDSRPVLSGVDIVDRWLRSLEMHAYDQRLALRAELNPRRDDPKAAERLLFVEIDDNSLARYGRWPWPREVQAELVATLKRLGCRGVLTDVEYPERSPAAGAPSPDIQLARALAMPSVGRPRRAGLPDGAAFGVSYLGIGGELKERRAIHDRRHLLDWAVRAAREAQPKLPDDLRRQLAEDGSQPELLAERAVALARLLVEQPMATKVDVLLAGTLRDLTPPVVPPELAKDEPVHIALALGAAVNAVEAERDASVEVLTRRTLAGLTLTSSPTEKTKGFAYAREFLPKLVAFCKERAAEIVELEEALDEIRKVMFETWIREEKSRDPRVDAPALTRIIAARLQLPKAERNLLAERVQQRRDSRDILLGRDLHVAPAGGLLDGLTPFGVLTPPIPELAAAYSGIGISTVERDEGGVTRRQRLAFRVEAQPGDPVATGRRPRMAFHASIPVVAFLRGLDLDRAESGPGYLRLPARQGGQDVVIPVDEECRTLVDFRGKWHGDGFERVSASNVLAYAERLKQREDTLRQQPDYVRTVAQLDALTRVRPPYGPLPLPAPTLFGHAIAGASDFVVDALTALLREDADKVAQQAMFQLAMEIRELFDAIAEARRTKNQADLAEATAMLMERRVIVESAVTEYGLLEAELRRKVTGAFCLVGVTSTATTDMSATPLDPQYVNIGVHANLIDQMLRGDYLVRPEWSLIDRWVLIGYLALVTLVLPALSIRKGSLAVLALVLFHIAGASALMIYRAIWIDGTTPVLALVTAYTFITIRRYLMEERAKDYIHAMFATYLDPRVVKEMLEDEGAFKDLGGTTREITAFFSDIEGFTTISELLDPDELSEMLQRYLTPMTDSILKREGLRDKYIGDAIVAMFGAPRPSQDHAAQGALAAVEQLERLTKLKAEWETDGLAWYRKIRRAGLDLNFRIGLNTGRAKVGNFGAERAKNYTMIGDSVNLAARLEGANKAYHTRIMISETTYRGARHVIEARELDLLRVVGKVQPVTVFEVLGRKGEVDPARVKMAAAFGEALASYRAKHFNEARARFAEILRQFPDDAPTLVYLKRLDDAEYVRSLPPEWDGSFSSKEK